MGHNVGRLDPARLGTPYHPLQVGSTYISPSPQPVSPIFFLIIYVVHINLEIFSFVSIYYLKLFSSATQLNQIVLFHTL